MQDEESVYSQEYEGESVSAIVYNSEDFISTAKHAENATVPFNFLEFKYSFGYDCKKRFNLCVADDNNLIFASGNLIHFFNIQQKKITFRRCSTGGGIGFITKNPTFEHIAIGENGINPPIIIYEWPSMEIVTVLQNGTTRSYSSLRYSPDGLQLLSQGGEPDYLITVWNWKASIIALQCKSHGQDIFNIVFSPTLYGRIVTCGSGHIKCWKIAKTFTGLKLQGQLGRFGKTEISDIVSIYPMPDEKIISGCEWGNILVWAEGLIKTEVTRKNNKPCHNSYISQFEYINGELISIGTDGRICIWYYETIDIAIPSDTSNILEVEPIYEFMVQNQEEIFNSSKLVMLMQILKRYPKNPENGFWFAQDGNGGISLLDLSDLSSSKPAKKLMSCHAGPIMDMDTSDWGPYAATIGEDGCLHIYNYSDNTLILMHRFQDIGGCIIWLPCYVEPTGSTIICAFMSGTIRMVNVDLFNNGKKENENVKLMQVVKPHTKKITRMSINANHSLLITGSEDLTIFAFHIQVQESYPNLVPIGYIEVPSSVSFFTWKPNHIATLFIGCIHGDCVEVELPQEPQKYTTVSYKLVECKPIIFKFKSIKSVLIREQFHEIAEERKQQKLAEKKEELRQMKQNNPGMEIEEDVFLESAMEEDLRLPEIYIPEVPNAVLMAIYTSRNSLLLFMSQYDAGYIYEYSNPEANKETICINSHLVKDCNDDEIQCYLFYNNQKYIIFGMEHGEIRVCKINPDNEVDFSNYWILPMHDNSNGSISAMCLSYDHKILLTSGHDSNIFSFFIHDDSPVPEIQIPIRQTDIQLPSTETMDIELDHPSLEEVIVLSEKNRVTNTAKEERAKMYKLLHQLSEEYNSILKKNNNLPISQRLAIKELELDPRITEDLNKYLKKQMDIVKEKTAFNVEKSKLRLKKLMHHFVEPITCIPFAVKRILRPDTLVYSLRELKLTGEFSLDREYISNDQESFINNKIDKDRRGFLHQATLSKSSRDDKDSPNEDIEEGGRRMYEVESFLRGLSPQTIQLHLGEEVNQMLNKYRSLKIKLEEHKHDWEILESQKPDRTAIKPEDESIIDYASNTIGNYKLKTDYSANENRETVLSKYVEMVDLRRKIHFRRESFNNRLRNLRTKKVELQNEVEMLIRKQKNIHYELPDQLVKPLTSVPHIDQEIEFPEKNLKMETYVSMEYRVRESKMKKQNVFSVLPIDDFDEEFEVLLLNESLFRNLKPVNIYKDASKRKGYEEVRMVRNIVPVDVLAAMEEADKVDSKLEYEMKQARVAIKIYEQDQILDYVRKTYEAFDEKLDELERERVDIIYESVYIELYILTTYQELDILKKFESIQYQLTDAVNSKLKFKARLTNKIKKILAKIEENNQYVSKIQEKISDMTARYISTIKDNKFYNFLKKICKKKYKPLKGSDESSSSSTSSSETSSDEEFDKESEDSDKIKIIHVDENICPPECNRELYDEAFTIREKRYELEFRINDEQRLTDSYQKELDLKSEKLQAIEIELSENRKKLRILLTEKQRQLNEIDLTIILKLHQFECINFENMPEKIQNCIIFDKKCLSQLYLRVGELQKDIAENMVKYNDDKIYFRKIKADCEVMKQEINRLKKVIKKEMKDKFGQEISLVTLYESVLKRLIYDIKANASSLIKFYDNKIKSIKYEYMQQLEVLKNLIQDNTQKLSILTVLDEELLKLRKLLNLKFMSEEEINKLESEYESELFKLKRILKDQEKYKASISKDIKILSKTSKNLLPIDELKLNLKKQRYRPSLALFDVERKDKTEYKECLYYKDKKSVHIESTEYSMNDHDEHIDIHNILSQMKTVDEINTVDTINNMLSEISDNLVKLECSNKKFDENMDEIIELSDKEEIIFQLPDNDISMSVDYEMYK